MERALLSLHEVVGFLVGDVDAGHVVDGLQRDREGHKVLKTTRRTEITVGFVTAADQSQSSRSG